MASQVGQPSQVELLLVYGADPGAFDAGGRTPAEHARSVGSWSWPRLSNVLIYYLLFFTLQLPDRMSD